MTEIVRVLLKTSSGEFRLELPEGPHVDDYVKIPQVGEPEFCIQTRSWEQINGRWWLVCTASEVDF